MSKDSTRKVARIVAEGATGGFFGVDLLLRVLQFVNFRRVGKRLTQTRAIPVEGSKPQAPPRPSPNRNVQPFPWVSDSRSAGRDQGRRTLMWVAVVPLSVLLLIAASVTVLAIGRPGGSRSANETRDTSASLTSEARDSETATEQTVDLDRPAGQTNTLSDPSWEELSRSVVLIDAQGVDCDWQGSGTIILDGSYVLTNEHVAGDANCDLFVWLTDSVSTAPKERFSAVPVAEDVDADLSLIRIVDENGNPFRPSGRRPLEFETSSPQLGDKIYILGYPSLGGSTITLTSGDFAGVELSEAVEFFKTTANMNPGVSGGAGLSARGKLVGIPTAGIGADVTCDAGSNCIANGSTIGLLRPIAYARELIRGLG